jgi:hypothetical protein
MMNLLVLIALIDTAATWRQLFECRERMDRLAAAGG